MTTNNFIDRVNALTSVYARKHREDNRMVIECFISRNHMSFAEILVKKRILNFFVLPPSTKVAEDVSRELLRLIADYQLGDDDE